MDKEKLLNNLIFNTELIDNSTLNEKEVFCIKEYLLEKKAISVISNEIDYSNEAVRKIIENGMGKIFFFAKELISKNKWLKINLEEKERIQNELNEIKYKFRKQLAVEKQLKLTFIEDDLPFSKSLFSVRANSVLTTLKINTINDFKQLTIEKLKSIDRVGVKTIHEIIRRGEEIGIKIQ